MKATTRLLTWITMAVGCWIILGMRPSLLAQSRVSNPDVSACEREIKKLGSPRMGEKIRQPLRTRRVTPAYPAIPEETTGGGVWIGEVLINALGRVSNVWTLREVKLTPPVPLLNRAITDAVAKWEFAPAAVDDVPVPVCFTVTVTSTLRRSGMDGSDRRRKQLATTGS